MCAFLLECSWYVGPIIKEGEGAYKPLVSICVPFCWNCVMLMRNVPVTNFFGGASWQ